VDSRKQRKACFPHAVAFLATEHVQRDVLLALGDKQKSTSCASTSLAFLNLFSSSIPSAALQRYAVRPAVEALAGATAPAAAPSLSLPLGSRWIMAKHYGVDLDRYVCYDQPKWIPQDS
jgi:hypothetical protein